MEKPEVVFDEHVDILGRQLYHGGQSLRMVPEALKVVLGKNAFNKPMWRERYCSKVGDVVRFNSFAEFVEARPPKGLGATVQMLKNICRDDTEALDMIDRAVRRPNGHHAFDNIQSKAATGTSRDAALRRLRDHRPDLHAKVLAGEMSPHAAMIEAGFRKRTITLPDDVDDAAATIMRRFGNEASLRLADRLRALAATNGA